MSHTFGVLARREHRYCGLENLGKSSTFADNVTANAGAGGATFATDQDSVGLQHYPLTKIVFGPLDTFTIVSTTNGLPVAQQGTWTVGLSAGTNNIGDVDVLTLPAGTVAGSASLPAGTNNIGDVDVLTLPATTLAAGNLVHIDYDTGAGTQNIPMVGMALPASGGSVAGGTSTNPIRVDPTGTTAQPITDNAGSLTIDNSTLAVVGGGTEATAMRVTIANDSTGLVSVDDNAGSLTIDNAALSVTGGGVEASALRVTIASDSTGVLSIDDNAGSLTVDGTVTANAGTGTFTAGGVAAHDAAVSGNPVLLAGRANLNEPAEVSADGDVTTLWVDRKGSQIVTLNFPANTAAATHGPNTTTLTVTGEASLVTGVASNSIYVTSLMAGNTSATKTRVDIKDGAAGTIRISQPLAADGGGFVLKLDPPWKLTAGNSLRANLSTAVTDVRVNAMFFVAP